MKQHYEEEISRLRMELDQKGHIIPPGIEVPVNSNGLHQVMPAKRQLDDEVTTRSIRPREDAPLDRKSVV